MSVNAPLFDDDSKDEEFQFPQPAVWRGLHMEEEDKMRAIDVQQAIPFDMDFSMPHLGSLNTNTKSPQNPTDSFPASRKKQRYEDIISSLDAMTVSQQTRVPALPEFYEQYSSFSSNEQPNDLLRRLVHVLKRDEQADVESIVPQKFKIKALIYRFGQEVKCHIHLFQKKDGALLVEVQRRRGDCMTFMTFYRELAEKMGHPIQTPTKIFVPPVEPLILDDATLAALVHMAGCDLVDVCNEGAKALHELSCTAANADLMANNQPCMTVLQKLLSSADGNCNRHAAAVVRNIVAQQAARDVVMTFVYPNMVNLMKATKSAETRRQLAASFATLGRTHAQQLCSAPLQDVLSRFQHDSDHRLIPHVMETLDFLTLAS